MKQTQCDAILKHLLAGYTLTALDALDRFGTMKLATRISELRRAGHPIQSDTIKLPISGKRICKYWILPADLERAA